MPPIRVLLVDDEEDLSLVLAERLQMRGFDAEGVTSGETALSRIEQKQFDVLVVDVKMPGLGGLNLLRKLRQRNPRSQVILFTGHGSTQEAEEGIREGAFEYLVKPVEIEELVKKIQQAAGRP